MGGGASVQKATSATEASEFASYRETFQKAKGEGASNHDIFEKISKAHSALHDEGTLQRLRPARAGSHHLLQPAIDARLFPRTGLSESKRRKSDLGVVTHDTRRHRRNQIFEDGFDFTLDTARQGMAKLKGGVDKTKEVFQDGNDTLILEALVNFFFMGEDCADQMNALIDTMHKEAIPAGQWLMREGESGDAMYVIKTGKLEVYVGGSLTRQIGRGGAVGELALLYHMPRSASVKAVEDCEMFTLQRSKFREMLALSVSASLVQRVAWMQSTSELEPLDKQAASRLAGAFSTLQLRHGETLAVEGETVHRCYMIEYGSVEVTSSTIVSPEMIKKGMHVAIPKRDTSATLRISKNSSLGSKGGGVEGVLSEATGVAAAVSSTEESEQLEVGANRPKYEELEKAHGDTDEGLEEEKQQKSTRGLLLGPGAFLGMPVLLCAGKSKKEASWPAAPEGDDHEQPAAVRAGDEKGCSSPSSSGFAGAICPFTITAKEDLRVGYFTPNQFEVIVGRIQEIFSQQLRGRPSLVKKAKSQRFIRKELDERFIPDDFQTQVFLGTGSFGRVTLVTFKDKEKQEGADLADSKHFALKALSKKAVVERGQLAHVKDEKLLLQNMDHALILKLFSTFQDSNSIYFLMEAVTAGEMWSIIYEGASGYAEGELPIEHGRFYAACVLEALAYMHSRGVAYRDLKPENIMVDGEGYPRVIDLGFAKKIPFTVIVDGKPEVHPKSFTMCGTPEYLAPEFIFNAGHDKSVDCWALGVLTFEFTAGYTPFQPPSEPTDMTALFTRIAGSKGAVSGRIFPSNYDAKAKNAHSRDIVAKFLQAEPTQRLGNLADGMEEARRHPYFADIDWNGLANKKMPAPWKPLSNLAAPAIDEGSHKDVPFFTGDQSIFTNW